MAVSHLLVAMCRVRSVANSTEFPHIAGTGLKNIPRTDCSAHSRNNSLFKSPSPLLERKTGEEVSLWHIPCTYPAHSPHTQEGGQEGEGGREEGPKRKTKRELQHILGTTPPTHTRYIPPKRVSTHTRHSTLRTYPVHSLKKGTV